MGDKKNMCGCNDVNPCLGHCGGHMMSKYHLARMLLYIAILLFTFWIGLGLGELKGYLRYSPLDSGFGIYPTWMMRQRSTNGSQNPAMGIPGTVNNPAQSPGTEKK